MVCHGPDPPENHENSPEEPRPTLSDLLMHGPHADDSGDEMMDYVGYEPLPQRLDQVLSDSDTDDDDDTEVNEPAAAAAAEPVSEVPTIESMESELARQVWNAPRTNDTIEMDPTQAQQVMSAMANFRLPATAIPEWARSLSEEQLQRTLVDTVHRIKDNT